MLKIQSLRNALEKAVPELKVVPEKLTMYVKTGKVATRWSPHDVSYEYRYTLSISLLDWSRDPDLIFMPIIAWLGVNQLDVLQNHSTADSALTFEADMIDAETVDIMIDVQLSEPVEVKRDGSGKFIMRHLPEPKPVGPAELAGLELPCGVKLTAVYDQAGNLIVPDPDAPNP